MFFVAVAESQLIATLGGPQRESFIKEQEYIAQSQNKNKMEHERAGLILKVHNEISFHYNVSLQYFLGKIDSIAKLAS